MPGEKCSLLNNFCVIFSFECGRWLGKGIDDDSTERLLIGRREEETHASRTRSQARLRSPSVPPPRRPLPLQEIHHMLGNDDIMAIS